MAEQSGRSHHEELLSPLRPNENALTAYFQGNVDESMLREVAAADYGWRAEECFQILQPVWKTGAPAPYDSDLREALELIRWSEPEDPDWAPGGHGARGHWMRLFACVELVRLAARHSVWFSGEADKLAQLASSAVELGLETSRAAASVLSWRFLTGSQAPEERPFLALAILLLAARVERAEKQGAWLKTLAIWVEEEESLARRALGRSESPYWNEWLLGLTHFRQCDAAWRSLADRILSRPESPHPAAADEHLRLIGELLANG